MGLISKKAKTSAGRLFGINRIYGEDGAHETPYMTRAWLGRLRLHIFHRGDQDPDCHDHPWGFWTFPLRSYMEEVLEERVETRFVPDQPVLAGYDPNGDPVWLEHRSIGGGTTVRTVYFERRLQVVKAFRLHYRPASHKHRVLGLAVRSPHTTVDNHWSVKHVGTIPTIVWTERPSRSWGFYKERFGRWCFVPWKDYVFGGGKSAPCDEQGK